MTVRCYTRALKNVRYLQRTAPSAFRKAKGDVGFGTGVPLDILQRVHRLPHDSPALVAHEAVSRFLKRHEIPQKGRVKKPAPLFSGTIHFAQLKFETPKGTFSFSTPDMQAMVRYAKHAIVPLTKMVRQYGPSSASVSPKLLRFNACMADHHFSDLELQSWIRQIVKQYRLSSDSCVIVPCPQPISDRSGAVGANSGYHGYAPASKVPYIVLGIHCVNLKLTDRPDSYAMAVSHEIAEMMVDPRANDRNPEVCDPCCANCLAKFYRAYFTASNAYLGTNRRTPPGGLPFAYYTAVVVKPAEVATPGPNGAGTKAGCDYKPRTPRSRGH